MATYSYLVTEWDEACHPGNCCALVVLVVIPRHCNLLDDGVPVDVVDGFYQHLEVKLTKERKYYLGRQENDSLNRHKALG